MLENLVTCHETDLATCTECGVTALYWQLGGHECNATIYGLAKGLIAKQAIGENGHLLNVDTEATARAYWRYLVRTGNRFDLLDAVNMYEGDTARAFIRKSVWDYLSIYGMVEYV